MGCCCLPYFKDHSRRASSAQPNFDERLRMPRKGEIFGVVTALQGGARMLVQCEDAKERMCRVPGSIKRHVWVKDGDIVLIEPWSVQGDEKADITYRYTRLQVEKLRQRGILKMQI